MSASAKSGSPFSFLLTVGLAFAGGLALYLSIVIRGNLVAQLADNWLRNRRPPSGLAITQPRP